MKKIKMPSKRASRADNSLVIPMLNRYGYGLKIAIRNEAKKLPSYHEPIECEICGRDDSGNEIPINTIGRWVFGTPGYMGHAMFDGGENEKIIIYLPHETPEIVVKLLIAACKKLGPQ
ncbi:MAG: hypothetical protein WC144_06025 [Sulfurimonas sp.]